MSKPTDCISVLEAKALQAKWMTTRAVDIENAQGSKDTCAVTFNIDQLQQFIKYVKEESESQGISKPGIRVYFAANDSALTNKATVFLCATDGDNANSNNNYNIDPLNKGGNGWPPNAY
ncbi:MAG: hypothetical protein DRI70_08390 [Bacteroidetes bacterium]|nr:MAG: hypothetical protein DRI70_08390 [Bacteroidota bacterium]